MEKTKIDKIEELVNKLQKEDGWTDMALLGKELSNAGINYKAMGYLKLRTMFEDKDLVDIFAIRSEPVNGLNVYYVKVGKLKDAKTHTNVQGNATKVIYRKNSIQDITSWAYLGDFKKVISDLKSFAIEERWYYKKQHHSYQYPILTNYLKYTFSRLYNEKKIKSTKDYSAFNTGLVNKLYEPIYAVFDKNRNADKQKWHYMGFCIAGQDKFGKILTSEFKPLPERAEYFKHPADLFYDYKEPPQLDWEHIILENIGRLPYDFIEENVPSSFVLKDVNNMEKKEKIVYYQQLAESIRNDSKKFRNIKNRFADSLTLALKRVEWNYKTAIPMYYPTKNILSLLLPLSLMDESRIDLALVTEKMPSGNYQGHTILPLEWAYSNARLITRPDSDWLVADAIEEMDDSDED